MEKKGEVNIMLIIAIAIGVLILVFSVFGLTGGFGGLWDKVTNIGGVDSNVDSIISGCEVACSTNNQYDYCEKVRTIKFGETVDKNGKDCTVNSTVSSKDCKKSWKSTCYASSNALSFSCPEIDCFTPGGGDFGGGGASETVE